MIKLKIKKKNNDEAKNIKNNDKTQNKKNNTPYITLTLED